MTQTERHVRLFRNGRNQALRIPREFELEGDEAIIRKDDGWYIVNIRGSHHQFKHPTKPGGIQFMAFRLSWALPCRQ
jgi:virulence-associated protein VagC